MKILCLGVLALCACALVAGEDLLKNEIPSDGEVKTYLGPYSQQFVFLKGNPEYEPSSDLTMDSMLGRSLIATVIENALNDFRDVVINGSDNLPPLDPLVIDKVGPVEFTLTGVRGQASLSNLRAEGLQWYVVDYVTFNALRLDFGVHITLPWLTVTGSYDTEVRLAILLTHRAGGNFRIFLNRFDIGVNARLGANIFSGQLFLRELDIKLDIHDTFVHVDGMTGSAIINSFISSYIQNLTQDVVQSQMATVSQVLSEQLFDVVNEFLSDFTLADIMG